MKKVILGLAIVTSISAFADTTISYERANPALNYYEIQIDQNAPRNVQSIQGAGSVFYVTPILEGSPAGSYLLCDLVKDDNNGQFKADGGQVSIVGLGKFRITGDKACVVVKDCLQKHLPSSSAAFTVVFPHNVGIEVNKNTKEVIHVKLPNKCDIY